MTKIGVAIHVKFILADGTFRYVDCDLNIPTIPVCTKYDGNIEDIGKYLLRTRPVGGSRRKASSKTWERREDPRTSTNPTTGRLRCGSSTETLCCPDRWPLGFLKLFL